MFIQHSLIILVSLLTACTQVSYVEHGNAQSVDAVIDRNIARQVDYHLPAIFYNTPPTCIMVLPTQPRNIPLKVSKIIDDAVGRYFSSKVNKVIDHRRTLGEARARAYDLNVKSGRENLARNLKCNTYAEIDAATIDSLFAVVWTDISLNIRLTLKRARDSQVIWRSQHQTRRGDGGLPLTIFGAGAGTFAAGRLAGDADVLPSMVDDCVRRMVASLPDTRTF